MFRYLRDYLAEGILTLNLAGEGGRMSEFDEDQAGSGTWRNCSRCRGLIFTTSDETCVPCLKAERTELREALEALVKAEWMVSHDWGGDRDAALEKARAALAGSAVTQFSGPEEKK